MSQSEQVDQLYAALAQAQGEMENAAFDSINPHFKSKYASLAATTNAIRRALSKHGIALFHTDDIIDGREVMVTTLGHKSGQWIQSQTMVTQNLKVQERAAWNTYARRRVVSQMTGISADEDDDGNLAQKANGKRENPNVNKPEDFAEYEIQYDTAGNPIDNVPYSEKPLERLSVAASKREYAALQGELIALANMAAFKKWVNLPQIADRVHTLAGDYPQYFRNLCESKKRELILAEENSAANH